MKNKCPLDEVYVGGDPLPKGLVLAIGKVLEDHGYALQRCSGHKWDYGDGLTRDGTVIELRIRGEMD